MKILNHDRQCLGRGSNGTPAEDKSRVSSLEQHVWSHPIKCTFNFYISCVGFFSQLDQTSH